jgi:hypothetical protein
MEFSIISTPVPHESTFLVWWGGLSKRQYISNEGIELQPSTNQRFVWKLLKFMAIFKYKNSLLVKARIILIFRKKTSNIPVNNGSSLNISITIKIIALTSRTLIETSVLLLYLLLYYLIFNLSLLCTSCGDSKICLPSLYILIEFSPND